MRLALALAFACAAALAGGPPAAAHGGEVIARAIEKLRDDPVYVDPTSVPRLEPAQADALREQIDAAGGRIYVAVLPADAQHELATADAVLQEIAAAVGGESTFAVVVGGQFRAASVDRPETAEALEEQLLADAEATPAERLDRFVEGVRDARSSGSGGWFVLGGGVVAVLAALGLLALLRRRRTPATTPEAAT